MQYTLLEKRIKILNKLGGLTKPAVYKSEWTDILTEEARNSVMIEGIYVTRKEAEAVLAEKEPVRSANVAKMQTYHKVSTAYYERAFADFQKGKFTFSYEDFRKLNGMMLLDELIYPGLRRENLKAPDGIDYPDFVDLQTLLDIYIDYLRSRSEAFRVKRINIKDFLAFLAKQHCYFQSIHPFEDGNGRVGRILSNYILVACGLPVIILKGDDSSRENYFGGIVEFKEQMGYTLSLPQSYHNIPDKLHEIDADKMSFLFADLLRESLDMLLCVLLEKKGYSLKPLGKIRSGLSIVNLKILTERHNFIAVKRGRDWFSHEDFDLRKDTLFL